MSGSKKKRPLSEQEIARRKAAAEKQAQLHGEPEATRGGPAGPKTGKIAAKKTQNFRHQGR